MERRSFIRSTGLAGVIGTLVRAMPCGHMHRRVMIGGARRGRRHTEWHQQNRKQQDKARHHLSSLEPRDVHHNGFKRRSRVR